MKYDDYLKKYTEEYEKYVKMGLSEKDAKLLIENHIEDEINSSKFSYYDILKLYDETVTKPKKSRFSNFYDTFFNDFDGMLEDFFDFSFEKEKTKDEKKVESSPEEKKAEDKKEEVKKETPSKKEEKPIAYEKKVIADTPNHKEFTIKFPNGFYTYKMVIK